MSIVSLLVYPHEARALLGVSETKFRELVKLPDFPKPRRPGMKRPMYVRKEIEDWVKGLAIE